MRCHDVGLSGKWALLPPLACLPIAALALRRARSAHRNLLPRQPGLVRPGPLQRPHPHPAYLARPGGGQPLGPTAGPGECNPALLGALIVAGAYAALIVFGLKLLPR